MTMTMLVVCMIAMVMMVPLMIICHTIIILGQHEDGDGNHYGNGDGGAFDDHMP